MCNFFKRDKSKLKDNDLSKDESPIHKLINVHKLINEPHSVSDRKIQIIARSGSEEVIKFKNNLLNLKETIDFIKSTDPSKVNEFIQERNLSGDFFDILALYNIDYELNVLGLSDSEFKKRGISEKKLSTLKELCVLANELNLDKRKINRNIEFFKKKGISKDDDLMTEINNELLSTLAYGKIYSEQIDQINNIPLEQYKVILNNIEVIRINHMLLSDPNELKEDLQWITSILEELEIEPLLEFYKSSNVEIEETGICLERLKLVVQINEEGAKLERRLKRLVSYKKI